MSELTLSSAIAELATWQIGMVLDPGVNLATDLSRADLIACARDIAYRRCMKPRC